MYILEALDGRCPTLGHVIGDNGAPYSRTLGEVSMCSLTSALHTSGESLCQTNWLGLATVPSCAVALVDLGGGR